MLNDYIKKKLEYKNLPVFISAIFCGIAMGFVSIFAIVLSAMTQNAILSKLIYGSAFTALLLIVVLNGYELFTGNTMLLTVINKKQNVKKVLLNLFFVYFGNLFGCMLASMIIKLCGIHSSFDLNEYLLKVFMVKTQMNVGKMFLLGICANYFVCMGVYLSFKANSVIEKYLSLFFPICLFCVLGFEHSVANMFTLFYALLIIKGSVALFILNLFFVTIGNILGGVLFALTTKVKK